MQARNIADYAMIGDCETAALVHRNGDISWMCWPDFASPACFADLLGSPENGHWTLAPADGDAVCSRRYRPHTLILETTMKTRKGVVLVTDFMPVRGQHSDLIRRVTCLEGRLKMRTELCPRFDYGSSVPWITSETGPTGQTSWIAKVGTNLTVLRTGCPLKETAPGTLASEFTIEAGESQTFALTYGRSYEPVPAPIDVDAELEQTETFWTGWAARNQYAGPYQDAVERSLITLKALTYRPSGGIVAAPTTSLPERAGASLNWDYRYCWIRDATLSISALTEAGYTDEVMSWKHWLIRAVGKDTAAIQIMYGIRGERHIPGWEVPWLRGFDHSSPVRIGNAAQHQKQRDIYGEIAAALYQAREAGLPRLAEELPLQEALTTQLAKIWNRPGSGMWEQRGEQHHYIYSGATAWLTLDRAVGSIERHGMGGPLGKWRRLRDKVHADVCKHGFNKRLNSFVQHYDSDRLDASVLLLPIVGFLPATDPRMLGTVNAIERKLMRDGLLLRNIPQDRKGKQGAFLACSFWLVENYAMAGRVAAARTLFEKLLGLCNDVGLLAEEYDTESASLTGNFPQAFSHLSLVRAASRLAKFPR